MAGKEDEYDYLFKGEPRRLSPLSLSLLLLSPPRKCRLLQQSKETTRQTSDRQTTPLRSPRGNHYSVRTFVRPPCVGCKFGSSFLPREWPARRLTFSWLCSRVVLFRSKTKITGASSVGASSPHDFFSHFSAKLEKRQPLQSRGGSFRKCHNMSLELWLSRSTQRLALLHRGCVEGRSVGKHRPALQSPVSCVGASLSFLCTASLLSLSSNF